MKCEGKRIEQWILQKERKKERERERERVLVIGIRVGWYGLGLANVMRRPSRQTCTYLRALHANLDCTPPAGNCIPTLH